MTAIVHVVRSSGFAGVEGFVAGLARAQAAAGEDVRVIGGESARMRAVLGGEIPHTPAATVADVVRAMLGLAQAPDIVNVHMTAAEVGAALVMALRRWRPTPVVVATRHFAAARGAGSGWARPVVAAVAGRCIDAQIAVSRFVADAVDGEAHVVHSGVPDQPLPATPRERTVLVAQRLEPEKHTEDAVVAFAESGLARSGWRLQIAGDGSARGALVARVAELGICADVDVLGHRADVAELMHRAGILLAPTPREGLGLAVLEAMALGLPVIAAASGGHLETVGGVDGGQLYTQTSDAAGRLRALAEDGARRAAYGLSLQRAQRERFSVAAQVAGTAAVYRQAMAARR